MISHASSDKVLGVHVLGPSAGEVLQGFAVAMRAGVTKVRGVMSLVGPIPLVT